MQTDAMNSEVEQRLSKLALELPDSPYTTIVQGLVRGHTRCFSGTIPHKAFGGGMTQRGPLRHYFDISIQSYFSNATSTPMHNDVMYRDLHQMMLGLMQHRDSSMDKDIQRVILLNCVTMDTLAVRLIMRPSLVQPITQLSVGYQARDAHMAAQLPHTGSFKLLVSMGVSLYDISGYIDNNSINAISYCMGSSVSVHNMVDVLHGVYRTHIMPMQCIDLIDVLMPTIVCIEQSLVHSGVCNSTIMSTIIPKCTRSIGAPMFGNDRDITVLVTNIMQQCAPQYTVVQAKLKCSTLIRRVLGSFMGGGRCYGCLSLMSMLCGGHNVQSDDVYQQCYDVKDVVDVHTC